MKLYPHQTAAVDWLLYRKRACLADDQGLGKTIVAATAAARLGVPRVLVLAPSVVTWNWQRELRQWAGVEAHVVAASTDACSEAPIVVTSHALLRRAKVLESLQRRWDLIIVDESHFFRNRKAQRTRALVDLLPRTERAWFLTGTPMPNDASELWVMLHHLWPHQFSESWAAFRERYCKLRRYNYGDGWKVYGHQNVPELRARIKPHVLRRMKKDVLDLPAIRYESVVVRPKVMPPGLDDLLRKLKRRVGNQPVPLRGEAQAAVDEVTHVDDPAEAFEALRKHEDFSRFRRLCGEAKVDPLCEMLLQELTESDARFIVFAHHRVVMTRISAHLFDRFPACQLHGDMSSRAKQSTVDAFQDGAYRVCIAQITAAGIGITLTRATEAVFAEMSWTPGDNAQACDRFYRIGQTRPVRVRFFGLAGTIDETITDVLRRKTRDLRAILR